MTRADFYDYQNSASFLAHDSMAEVAGDRYARALYPLCCWEDDLAHLRAGDLAASPNRVSRRAGQAAYAALVGTLMTEAPDRRIPTGRIRYK